MWYLGDQLGTIRDLANNSGEVVNHYTYDSFGNLIAQTDDRVENRYLYTGREFDSETGLHYYRARYYNSSTGRFIGLDPIGFDAGDTNLYRYVGNSPIDKIDPQGTTSWELQQLLSFYSRPRLTQPSVYIYNVTFSDYLSAFITGNNWFLLITEPPNSGSEEKRSIPGPIPWLLGSNPLKGGVGRAVFRPIGKNKRQDQNPLVPTIELQKDRSDSFHMTPGHEKAGRIKFEWEKEDDSCPRIPEPHFDRDRVTVGEQPGKKEPFRMPDLPIPGIPVPSLPPLIPQRI